MISMEQTLQVVIERGDNEFLWRFVIDGKTQVAGRRRTKPAASIEALDAMARHIKRNPR